MSDKIVKARGIVARLWWMSENYQGCDWCCGGGDEEREKLNTELKELGLSEEEIAGIEPTDEEVHAQRDIYETP